MKNFKDSSLYKMGHAGEIIIKQILQKNGWYIIPSYDYTGNNDNKAPGMYGQNSKLVIPDLDISKCGKRLWAEVKTKSSPDWTHMTKRYEHGIPLKHYKHYLKVQEITGCDVWMYIYELATRLILREEINNLSTRIYNGSKMNPGGMCFFVRGEFEIIGYFDGKVLIPYIKYQDIANNVLSLDSGKLPVPIESNKISRKLHHSTEIISSIILADRRGYND